MADFRKFKAYLAETYNAEVVEVTFGFAVYSFEEVLLGAGVLRPVCYLRDIWVDPRYRREGISFQLLKMVEEKAKTKECVGVKGTANPQFGNTDVSIKNMIAAGFSFDHVDANGVLVFYKKLF